MRKPIEMTVTLEYNKHIKNKSAEAYNNSFIEIF